MKLTILKYCLEAQIEELYFGFYAQKFIPYLCCKLDSVITWKNSQIELFHSGPNLDPIQFPF